MKILISAANGKTGRHIASAIQARGNGAILRGLGRRHCDHVDESLMGDMNDPRFLARAVEGVDVVVHYGPPMHPRELAMGTAIIDAAKASGVRRFLFISVIHPEIDDLINHKAKLAIEGHLINSGLDWTVLRPQHYMQNVDVHRVVQHRCLAQPYPVGTILGHVDMYDLAEVAATVVMEPGHSYATYDISADQPLSVQDMASIIAQISGVPIEAVEIDPYRFIEIIKDHWPEPLTSYSVEAFHRLFGYYARNGIQGNANILTWLLGRVPNTFENYVQRELASLGPVEESDI